MRPRPSAGCASWAWNRRWECVSQPGVTPDLEEAIATIEDYHPLDVECAAASLVLLKAIRERHPSLTLPARRRRRRREPESLSAGRFGPHDLERAQEPAAVPGRLGHRRDQAQPYAIRAACRGLMSAPTPRRAPGLPRVQPVHDPLGDRGGAGDPVRGAARGRRRAALRAEGRRSSARASRRSPASACRSSPSGGSRPAPAAMPTASGKVSKAWCRQVFLRQWEERLRTAWDPAAERVSGNAVPA